MLFLYMLIQVVGSIIKKPSVGSLKALVYLLIEKLNMLFLLSECEVPTFKMPNHWESKIIIFVVVCRLMNWQRNLWSSWMTVVRQKRKKCCLDKEKSYSTVKCSFECYFEWNWIGLIVPVFTQDDIGRVETRKEFIIFARKYKIHWW